MRTSFKAGPKGFTLLELLIVIIILGVLAGLAIPNYQNAVERSAAQEAVRFLALTRESLIRHYTQYGRYDSARFSNDSDAWLNHVIDFDPNVASGWYNLSQNPKFFYRWTFLGANAFTLEAQRMRSASGVWVFNGIDRITMDQAGTITNYGIYT